MRLDSNLTTALYESFTYLLISPRWQEHSDSWRH